MPSNFEQYFIVSFENAPKKCENNFAASLQKQNFKHANAASIKLDEPFCRLPDSFSLLLWFGLYIYYNYLCGILEIIYYSITSFFICNLQKFPHAANKLFPIFFSLLS